MNPQQQMRILLSVIPQSHKPVTKLGENGEQFDCLAHHFCGTGLLEVTHRNIPNKHATVYRFSKHGELTGVFNVSSGEETELLFDRDSGLGDRDRMEKEAISLLEKLSMTITPKEELSYYL